MATAKKPAAKKPAARITKSLDTLRSQANKLAPKRSKASDGWLGDSKHSMRKSDHNPEPDGTVDAFDLTHDPANGVDIQKVCDAIIASKDKRVSYLICNGQIISGNGGPKPWVKRPYSGANKHDKHLHVSVLDAHQDDTTPWAVDGVIGGKPALTKPKIAPAKPVAAKKDIYDGNKHDEVETVQTLLDSKGYPEVGSIDGRWGSRTRDAVNAARADLGLPLTSKIDEDFVAKLTMSPGRVIAPKRANATVADLREQNVEEIKVADTNKLTGIIAAGSGGIVAASKGVEVFEGYGGIIKRVADTIEPVQSFVQDNLWLVLIGFGALVIWQSGILTKVRLAKHQTGNDVSR